MRCRHRLSKLLLRRGIRFDDGRAWTERHRVWLAGIDLGHDAAQATLIDQVGAVDALCHRREQLEREIVARLADSPWQAEIGRLRCLRGIDTLTAAGLCAEIGDFERFARAEQLMHYVGLVPSEHTTGDQRRLGAITKTGSAHARRLLVEAAWHYRKQPPSARRWPPARTVRTPTRSRSPGAPNSAYTAPGSDSNSAPSAAPSSPSPPPANSPASAGRSPPAPNSSHNRTARRPGRWRPGTRAGNPRNTYQQPAPKGQATPDPRQRHPTTNHGPAATRTRAYQPDRASRTTPPDRHPPGRPHTPPPARTRPHALPRLTSRGPYQM